VLLTEATSKVDLPKCPAWIDPNVGEYGYYRYSLDEKHWATFAGVIAKEDDSTRLAFAQNAWAQVEAGTLSPDTLLRLLPALDGESNRVVVDAEIEVLSQFSHELVSEAAAPAFARYVAARLLPHQRGLGANAQSPLTGKATANAKSPEDAALERKSLFTALADPTSVDGDLARVAVPMASRKAGADRIEALRNAMKTAKNPNDKKTALVGLAGFDDPALIDKALSVALTDEVRSQDVARVLWEAVQHPSSRIAATNWVLSHWDAIHTKLPGFLVGRTFGIASQACTKEEIERVSGFFGSKVPDVEGAARPYAEAIESATLCNALREKDGGTVDKFFNVKGKAAANSAMVAPSAPKSPMTGATKPKPKTH